MAHVNHCFTSFTYHRMRKIMQKKYEKCSTYAGYLVSSKLLFKLRSQHKHLYVLVAESLLTRWENEKDLSGILINIYLNN